MHHHGRFYVAAVLGVLVYFLCHQFQQGSLPLAAAGDAFFLSYIAMMGWMVAKLTPDDLRKNAKEDDEGITVVVLLALGVIGFCCVEIFIVLNQKNQTDIWPMLIAIAGAPLGWLMFHMMVAFHYANMFYRRGENGEPQDPPPLDFPETKEPGPWEFLYYSMVIGMTAQTSDVEVQCTAMRRTTTLHSLVSFLFNTVLIAMSVNAVVSRASGS